LREREGVREIEARGREDEEINSCTREPHVEAHVLPRGRPLPRPTYWEVQSRPCVGHCRGALGLSPCTSGLSLEAKGRKGEREKCFYVHTERGGRNGDTRIIERLQWG